MPHICPIFAIVKIKPSMLVRIFSLLMALSLMNLCVEVWRTNLLIAEISEETTQQVVEEKCAHASDEQSIQNNLFRDTRCAYHFKNALRAEDCNGHDFFEIHSPPPEMRLT